MALNLKLLNNNLLARFIIAGIVNTLFGWTIFSILILLDIAIPISLFFGMSLGILFNYITIGGYAFKKFSKKIFFKFILSNLFIYLLNLLLLSLIDRIIINVIFAQLFLAPFLALLSFIIMKKIVFK
jgi:putative flippase GtrA